LAAGLYPNPLRELERSPRPSSCNMGPISKGFEGRGGREGGREGAGEGRWR